MNRTGRKAAAGAVAWALAMACCGAVWNVPGDFGHPAAALADGRVADGDVIKLGEGVHVFGGHAADGELGLDDCTAAVRKGVTVAGADDAGMVTIDCGGGGGIVLDHPGARLEGVTLTNFCNVSVKTHALYLAQGVASNVVVDFRGECAVKVPTSFVYVGEGAALEDAHLAGQFNANNWGSGSGPEYAVVMVDGGRASGCRADNFVVARPIFRVRVGAGGMRGVVEWCELENNQSQSTGIFCAGGIARWCSIAGGNGCNLGGAHALVVRHWTASGGIVPGLIENCIVTGCNNKSNQLGTFNPTIRCEDGENVLRNCLFAGNSSHSAPVMAVNTWGARPVVENCTFADNRVEAGLEDLDVAFDSRWNGGTMQEARVTFANCIFSGNRRGDGTEANLSVERIGLADKNGVAYITVKHCCFPEAAGLEDGEGNVGGDPGFRDAGEGDYGLGEESPCRNAGLGAEWMAEAFDLAGAPRIMGRAVDIGCYEAPPRSGMTIVVR